MQWPEGVAARRRVLVASLVHCLARSKVCEVVDAATVQSVLNTAAAELWREGEFRLEYVWRMLCQQPELTAQIVAPPLLAFKTVEAELGVQVRLPPALVGLPKAEQSRLLEELQFDRAAFVASVEKLVAAEVLQEAQETKASSEAKPKTGPRDAFVEPAPQNPQNPTASPAEKARRRRPWAIGLSALALVSAATATTIVLLDHPDPLTLADTDNVLRLSKGQRKNKTMVAEIADPKWESLSRDEQQKLAERVFELEVPKGIFSMSLSDGTGRVRVVAGSIDGVRTVTVLPH